MLQVNEKYITECLETNNLGNGICKIDGMVVFVKGALKGEKLEIIIKELHKKYAIASINKIIISSKNRIESKCDCYDKCGGCCFLHCNIEEENEIKTNYIKEVLRKNKIAAEVENISTPIAENYRNKAILFFNGQRFGYLEENTNNIVPHTDCIVNDKLIEKIVKFSEENLLYKENLTGIFIRVNSNDDKEALVCPIYNKEVDIEEYANKIRNAFKEKINVFYSVCNEEKIVFNKTNVKLVIGGDYIEDEICGLNIQISPKSFYQINHDCAGSLYRKVLELIEVKEGDLIADLFCGTGTIGLIVGKNKQVNVIGIEIEKEAINDALKNSVNNRIGNVKFLCDDASNLKEKVSVCIIDPPRNGCSISMIKTLKRLLPKEIVYVSCNIDTFARDYLLLQDNYEIQSHIYPFNMFPRTSHVETVALLTLNPSVKK